MGLYDEALAKSLKGEGSEDLANIFCGRIPQQLVEDLSAGEKSVKKSVAGTGTQEEQKAECPVCKNVDCQCKNGDPEGEKQSEPAEQKVG